jgi:pSer/pThr/pTyr-binding forkhead associated (FHA) protein
MTMASLIVVSGANKDDYYPLGRRSNVIGRNEALPIQILDGEVSRKHLKIAYDREKGTYTAVDMKSRHGVMINGIKITGEAALADNTYITIGQTTLFFTLKDFEGRQSALSHYKKVGERSKPTLPDHLS